MSARNSFRKLAVTNGLKTTNFVANPALATSYNLTLPSTVPTLPGQSLISDTSGNLSWGSSVASVSTFTGTTNPLTTPTNVTGLLPTTTSSSISVYVAINASTNIYGLYTLKIYQKGSASSWGLSYDLDTDPDDTDPQVVFTVTSTGQVQYTIPNTIAGFTSVVMMWVLGNSVSNTLSSLALTSNLSVGGTSTFTGVIQGTSLTLSSTFNVTGLATHAAMSGLSLVLGNASGSGSVSSTVGSFLNVQSQTYTDTGTAASSTSAGSFSASYLGMPTLAATNTGVTTGTASTLTIAGPPVAGTNETITNAYALNILSGNANFGGNVQMNKDMTIWSSTASYNAGGSFSFPSTIWTVNTSYGNSTWATISGNSKFTATRPGEYEMVVFANWNCASATSGQPCYLQIYHSVLGYVGNSGTVTNTIGNQNSGPFSASAVLPMKVGDTLNPAGYYTTNMTVTPIFLSVRAVKYYSN